VRVDDLLAGGGGDFEQVGLSLRIFSTAGAWEHGVVGGLGQRDGVARVDL
jgi:hypothetical protein